MKRIRRQLRFLLAEPDVLAIAILTLVLGIGSETAAVRQVDFAMPCGTETDVETLWEVEVAPEFEVGPVAAENGFELMFPDRQL